MTWEREPLRYVCVVITEHIFHYGGSSQKLCLVYVCVRACVCNVPWSNANERCGEKKSAQKWSNGGAGRCAIFALERGRIQRCLASFVVQNT